MATDTGKERPSSSPARHLERFETLVVNAGVKPDEFLRRLKKDLASTPDPLRAANNLHRFLSTGFASSMIQDLGRHPVLRQIALEVFAQSQYLADILVRDPELFRWLTTTTALQTAKSRSELLEEALNSVQLFSRMEKKLDALRRFHRRETLRVGAREILKEADVTTIVGELSALADAVVEAVLQIGQQDLAARTGATFRNTLCVIGLGKLGGEELNFSSDIDLLFVYDSDGEFEAPQERIRTFHEYYNRLAEFIVRKLTEFGGEGHLYRVDMRLRPEGSAGPLALSRNAFLQYYEIRGELWERQMLLKARPIAGNTEVGNRWLHDIRPFVSPKTVLGDPIAAIARMKERIEMQPGIGGNIKLGEGGIRDIEFVVQALQLVMDRGKERPGETNTLLALERLAEVNALSARDTAMLNEAYRFLRTVEHRLQLLHGAQTHSLPETKEETTLLARRLGFQTASAFAKKLGNHRDGVRRIFDRVFHRRKGGAQRSRSSTVVELRPQFRRYGFADPDAANAAFESLAHGLKFLQRPENRHLVLSALKKFKAPDSGLQNVVLLASSPPIQRTLNQILASPKLVELLVLICSRSRKHAELLAREPLLFESLVGQPEEFFLEGLGWSFLRNNDWERFKSYNEFKILVPFLLGEQAIEHTLERLSALAEDVLLSQYRMVDPSAETCLLLLGKCGGREMNIGSDVDLVLLFDGQVTEPLRAGAIATELIQRFEGGPYELDFRLRPEGANAPLAIEKGYYEEYLRHRASLWERQSLVKARTLGGNETLAAEVLSVVQRNAFETELPRQWISQIRSMRDAMEAERAKGEIDLKMGKGGFVDLEFALQVLQLRFGGQHRQLRLQNSFHVLKELRELEIVPKRQVRTIRENLKWFRTVETFGKMNLPRNDIVIPNDEHLRRVIAAATGSGSVPAFLRKIGAVRKQTRIAYKAVLKACQ